MQASAGLRNTVIKCEKFRQLITAQEETMFEELQRDILVVENYKVYGISENC